MSSSRERYLVTRKAVNENTGENFEEDIAI